MAVRWLLAIPVVPLLLVMPLGLGACGEDSVRLSFRPAQGASATYIATTSTRTSTQVPGRAPDVEQGSVVKINHRVDEVTPEEILLIVDTTFLTVTENGLPAPIPAPDRSAFVIDRRGRATNLATTTITASDEARQGLPEVTAPFPDGPVRPGDQWAFPPPAGRAGFGGQASLVALFTDGGRPVAEVSATLATFLDDTEVRGRDGPVTIGGPLTIQLRGVYDTRTGQLVRSRQELTGSFRLRFTLDGSASPPVAGSQLLTVVTETRRV